MEETKEKEQEKEEQKEEGGDEGGGWPRVWVGWSGSSWPELISINCGAGNSGGETETAWMPGPPLCSHHSGPCIS